MTIERLEVAKLPYRRTSEPREIDASLQELIGTLQELLDNLIQSANLLIDAHDGDAVYFKPKSSDGQYPLGTWRFRQVGDNLQVEYLTDRDENTWEDVWKWEP